MMSRKPKKKGKPKKVGSWLVEEGKVTDKKKVTQSFLNTSGGE